MIALLASCIAFFLNLILSALIPAINIMIGSLTEYGLFLGSKLDTFTNRDLAASLQVVFTTFGLSLLTLAFLKKGFETYISYTDGDPENDPLQLLTLYCKCLVLIAIAPILFKYCASITDDLIRKAMGAIAGEQGGMGWSEQLQTFEFDGETLEANFLSGVAVIIYFILVFVMQILMVMTGIEFFVLQLGFPIAAIGMINADKGVFKSYGMAIIKVAVTVLVRVLLCHLSFVIVINAGSISGGTNFMLLIIIAIGLMITAFNAPKMLGEWMIPGGGGMMMKAYYASNMITKIIRK